MAPATGAPPSRPSAPVAPTDLLPDDVVQSWSIPGTVAYSAVSACGSSAVQRVRGQGVAHPKHVADVHAFAQQALQHLLQVDSDTAFDTRLACASS